MDPAKDMLEETQHELERAYAKRREVAEAMKSLNLAIARATSLMAMVKTIHNDASPLAGKTVRLIDNMGDPDLNGREYRVEDWFDRVCGGSWMTAKGHPTALWFASRTGRQGKLIADNDVLYGKVGSLGYAVHVSEIADDSKGAPDGE